jgi:sarcosine oxidase, subunit gamma
MLDLSKPESALDRLAGPARNIPGAMLAGLPPAAKLVFRGRPSAIEAAGRAFGTSLPQIACRFAAIGARTAYWLGPDEWLLHEMGADPQILFACMSAALEGHSHSLTDVSHRSEAFAISGANAAYILNHGCPLDLSLEAFPIGMCTRTILNKATIMLSRAEPEVFHIDVWRSFAPYVWQLLDEARGELALA